MADQDDPIDTDDLQALARRYLDMWEDHLAELGRDPAVAENMARAIELMNTGAAAFATMATDAQAESQAKRTERTHEPATDAPPAGPAGPPAHGHAPGPADADLDDLRRRLARLEERLDRLESALAPGGKAPG